MAAHAKVENLSGRMVIGKVWAVAFFLGPFGYGLLIWWRAPQATPAETDFLPYGLTILAVGIAIFATWVHRRITGPLAHHRHWRRQ